MRLNKISITYITIQTLIIDLESTRKGIC